MRATPPRRASFVGGDRPRVALFFLSVVVLCVFFERAVPPGGWGGGRRVANTLPIPPPRAPREAVVWRHSRDTNTNSETVTRSGVKRRDGKVTGDCRRAGPLESGPSEFIVARPREGQGTGISRRAARSILSVASTPARCDNRAPLSAFVLHHGRRRRCGSGDLQRRRACRRRRNYVCCPIPPPLFCCRRVAG